MNATRRSILGAGAAGLAAAGVTAGLWIKSERKDTTWPEADLGDDAWLTMVAKSLPTEHDYEAVIEGTLPTELEGTLYRNGPGLFDRGHDRKRHLLDGDGMIRATTFHNGQVRFRNRFVRTAKFIAEEKAGRFTHNTWTTLAPRWLDAISGVPDVSQAGVTAVHMNGQLLAFDEVGDPSSMDPATLDTTGTFNPAPGHGIGAYKAHTKVDGKTGDWILVGNSNGPKPKFHVVIRNKQGELVSVRTVDALRSTYIHDFFATETAVIINVHAVRFNPFPMLFGLKSFTDCLRFRGEDGNLMIVVPKEATQPVQVFELPGSFMWHALNAYDRGAEIVLDYVAYDDPNHFIGPRPAFNTIMQGKAGDPADPGTVRRAILNRATGKAKEDTLNDNNFEFPMINGVHACHPHRVGYFVEGKPGQSFFHTGLTRIDMETGARQNFDFGPGYYVGEPVFAAKPGASYEASATSEEGYLLCELHDGSRQKADIAIFDAAHIEDGPVARVKLGHHLPISFHGIWVPA